MENCLRPVTENALVKALRGGMTLDEVRDVLHVDVKPHPKYPNLLGFSYNMIESPMDNPIVQDCRGTILDSADNWEVVCWGFSKFFNLGEPNAAAMDWSTARFYDKADGSLCMMYFYDGDVHIATTGTPNAGGEVNGYGITFEELFWKAYELYAPGGKEKLVKDIGKFQNWDWIKGATFMFELVGPMNQVVVQYDLGLRLLGARQAGSHNEIPLEQIQWFKKVPRITEHKYIYTIQEALHTFTTKEGHEMEGYVAVDQNWNRVKIKHPGYVNLHRIRDGLSLPGIMELIQKGDSEEVVAYFPGLKEIHDKMKSWYDVLVWRLEESYQKVQPLAAQSRKDYALAVQALDVPFKNALYNLLKGQSIRSTLSETQSRYLLEVYHKEAN